MGGESIITETSRSTAEANARQQFMAQYLSATEPDPTTAIAGPAPVTHHPDAGKLDGVTMAPLPPCQPLLVHPALSALARAPRTADTTGAERDSRDAKNKTFTGVRLSGRRPVMITNEHDCRVSKIFSAGTLAAQFLGCVDSTISKYRNKKESVLGWFISDVPAPLRKTMEKEFECAATNSTQQHDRVSPDAAMTAAEPPADDGATGTDDTDIDDGPPPPRVRQICLSDSEDDDDDGEDDKASTAITVVINEYACSCGRTFFNRSALGGHRKACNVQRAGLRGTVPRVHMPGKAKAVAPACHAPSAPHGAAAPTGDPLPAAEDAFPLQLFGTSAVIENGTSDRAIYQRMISDVRRVNNMFFGLWKDERWDFMNTIIDACLAKQHLLPKTAGGERFPLSLQRESTYKLWRLLTERAKPALIYSDPAGTGKSGVVMMLLSVLKDAGVTNIANGIGAGAPVILLCPPSVFLHWYRESLLCQGPEYPNSAKQPKGCVDICFVETVDGLLSVDSDQQPQDVYVLSTTLIQGTATGKGVAGRTAKKVLNWVQAKSPRMLIIDEAHTLGTIVGTARYDPVPALTQFLVAVRKRVPSIWVLAISADPGWDNPANQNGIEGISKLFRHSIGMTGEMSSCIVMHDDTKYDGFLPSIIHHEIPGVESTAAEYRRINGQIFRGRGALPAHNTALQVAMPFGLQEDALIRMIQQHPHSQFVVYGMVDATRDRLMQTMLQTGIRVITFAQFGHCKKKEDPYGHFDAFAAAIKDTRNQIIFPPQRSFERGVNDFENIPHLVHWDQSHRQFNNPGTRSQITHRHRRLSSKHKHVHIWTFGYTANGVRHPYGKLIDFRQTPEYDSVKAMRMLKAEIKSMGQKFSTESDAEEAGGAAPARPAAPARARVRQRHSANGPKAGKRKVTSKSAPSSRRTSGSSAVNKEGAEHPRRMSHSMPRDRSVSSSSSINTNGDGGASAGSGTATAISGAKRAKTTTNGPAPRLYNGNFSGFVHSASTERKPKSAKHGAKKRKSASSTGPVAKRTSFPTAIAQPGDAKTSGGSFGTPRLHETPGTPLHTMVTSAPPPYSPQQYSQLEPAAPLPLPPTTTGRPQLVRFLREAGIGSVHIEAVLTIADEVGIEAPSDFAEVNEKELLEFGFKLLHARKIRKALG